MKLDDCDSFRIENVTFDGRLSVNPNTTKDGVLLLCNSCGGTNELEGVHLADNRGIDVGNNKSGNANAFSLVNCYTVNLTYCSGDNNGYSAFRTKGTDYATFDTCRIENPLNRGINEDTSSSSTVVKLTYLDCDFVRDKTRGTTAHNYSLMGNISNLSSTQMTEFLMRDCYADWRDAEGESTQYSWNYTGSQSTLLLKIEGIDTAKFEKCEFRHFANKPGGLSATLKLDKTNPVKNMYLDECIFSGAVVLDDTLTSASRNGLYVRGTALQKDGNFGQSAALWGVEYPNLVIEDRGSKNTTVDNIKHQGQVIRMTESFDTSWSWMCEDLVATSDNTSNSCWFIWSTSGSITTPTLSQMDQNSQDFLDLNEFNDATQFEFSRDDDTDLLNE